MVRPDAEADEAGGEEGKDDQLVTDQLCLRESGDHHRDEAGGGQEDDVDLGVTEEPEQMLPQHRVAAPRRVEERPVERALQLPQRSEKRRVGNEWVGKCRSRWSPYH